MQPRNCCDRHDFCVLLADMTLGLKDLDPVDATSDRLNAIAYWKHTKETVDVG
jgi:uncharacterized protein (DUF779 family)